ncbi:serine carboxypeptidase domain-containing protein [Ditylenchus destructor]|uniref:Carboxypeptidase n=1 Tax=Ditylenchus destructor TaxID=166010 RepID=A0AAD4NHZ3_9BILA|nr:serine carboxypeptidase domain-containing protein [Ditylenchus destructor]
MCFLIKVQISIVILVAFLNNSLCELEAQDDVIVSLPGLDFDIKFEHYSGYLNVSPTRRLHYWFVESQSNPANDPLLFWFNGGPGCSSLFGLLGEIGPYLVNADGETLRENPHTWNKLANIVFVESPVGTGFSYSIDGNITNSDDQSAEEAYEAIKEFLLKFPKFRTNQLFITGESYAGVFIPVLAVRILRYQNDFHMNFKGVAIGNGLLAYDDDVPTNYPWHSTVINYAYSHGLVDEDLWQYLKNECCGGCTENCDFFKLQGKCGAKVKEAQWLMRSLPSAYNIYSRCPHRRYMLRQLDSVSPEKEIIIPSAHDNIDENGECVPESALKNYLRKSSVRHALNIPPEVESWDQCRLAQLWDHGYIHQYFNMTKFVLEIVNSNVPVLLFFGDTDLVCNFMLGEQFAANLGLKQTSSKHMWLHEGVPGGSKTEYGSHLTFITVLGAGHMAPRDRAPEMYQVIKRFISGTSI